MTRRRYCAAEGGIMKTKKQPFLTADEINLTPREWAILTVDELRKHRSFDALLYSLSTEPVENTLFHKPMIALKAQIDARFPSTDPEDVRIKNKMTLALQKEYYTLTALVINVNRDIMGECEAIGLRTAMKLSRMETLALQDAFGRTARKAAEWVREYKTADAAEEESRQGMLGELSAYTELDFGEKWTDFIPLPGGIRFRFPSAIEDWVEATCGLLFDVFSFPAAAQLIRKKYFDGRPILSLNTEESLENTLEMLKSGIERLNEYFDTRKALFTEEWEEEEEEDGICSALPGEREGRLRIDLSMTSKSVSVRAKRRVDAWFRKSKTQAAMDVPELAREKESSPQECRG
jgi:hypothetical protein